MCRSIGRTPVACVGLRSQNCRSACHNPHMTQSDDLCLPHRVTKPWGYEIWYALTDEYAGKILHVDRGHRLSLQFHHQKDESCYLLAGQLLLIQGPTADELSERTISAGSVWRNRPGAVHTIEALEDSDVLEVSTPHLEDVVRLSDNYGREGTSQP
jgi:mannose-6-phosphate isomerase